MRGGKGYYIATVELPSGRRHRGRGLFARGNGEWEIAKDALRFRRYLTSEPLCIPFADIRAVTLGGSWFAGRWLLGAQAVLVEWARDGTPMRSGFLLSGKRADNAAAAHELSRRAKEAAEAGTGGHRADP